MWATRERRRRFASVTTRWPYSAKVYSGARRLSRQLDGLGDLIVVVLVNSLYNADLGDVATALGLECHGLDVCGEEEVEVSASEAFGEAVAMGHEEVGLIAQGCLTCVGVVGVLERGIDDYHGGKLRSSVINSCSKHLMLGKFIYQNAQSYWKSPRGPVRA